MKLVLLALVIALLTVQVVSAASLGNTSIGDADDSGDVGYALFVWVLATANGTFTQLQVPAYSATGGTQIKVAIYNISSGTAPTALPYSLVANSNGSANVTRTTLPTQDSQWTRISINAPMVAGKYYWLAFTPNDNDIHFPYHMDGTNDEAYASGTTYSTFPLTNGSQYAMSNTSYRYSIYVNYTVGGASTGNLTVNASTGGTATGSNSTFTPPANLTINATPNIGYTFNNWTTNCNGTINSTTSANTTILVNDATSCYAQANFNATSNPTCYTIYANYVIIPPGCAMATAPGANTTW